MAGRNKRTRRLLVARAIGYQLRESLFYLPALCVLLAAGATFAVPEIGERINPLPLNLSTSAATTLLATIGGAIITTAGVVISITVVSVQLASQQFSPRVVRGYFRDRLGQVVVGMLVATFTYCVLSLRDVEVEGSGTADLTVEVAILLAVASVLLIIAYLDRGARHLYVGTLLRNISVETIARINDMHGTETETETAAAESPDVEALGEGWVVPAPTDGWVQQISSDGVLRAVDPGSVVRLETRAGAFIVRGGALATIWPVPQDTEQAGHDMAKAVFIGDSRTMQQDIDFGLRQLNDVALRALSLAINDPTTAIEAILRLTAVMNRLLACPLPPQVRRDRDGSVLLRPWDLDHAEYVVHAFSQARNYAAPHPAIVAVLLRCLHHLELVARAAGHDDAAEACATQARLTMESAEKTGPMPEDLAWLRRVYERPHPGEHMSPSVRH